MYSDHGARNARQDFKKEYRYDDHGARNAIQNSGSVNSQFKPRNNTTNNYNNHIFNDDCVLDTSPIIVTNSDTRNSFSSRNANNNNNVSLEGNTNQFNVHNTKRHFNNKKDISIPDSVSSNKLNNQNNIGGQYNLRSTNRKYTDNDTFQITSLLHTDGDGGDYQPRPYERRLHRSRADLQAGFLTPPSINNNTHNNITIGQHPQHFKTKWQSSDTDQHKVKIEEMVMSADSITKDQLSEDVIVREKDKEQELLDMAAAEKEERDKNMWDLNKRTLDEIILDIHRIKNDPTIPMPIITVDPTSADEFLQYSKDLPKIREKVEGESDLD
jgi:hypothetical protein